MKKQNNKKLIKRLFETVEKARLENKSLIFAFNEFAKKTGRKPNSIRNLYYHKVEEFGKNPNDAKQLGICVENHQVLPSKKFTPEETKTLVKEVLRQKCLGTSTRKACFNLAKGNLGEMIRLQNKFRSSLLDKELYQECLKELKNEGLIQKDKNILYMKKREEKRLSDEDVNSLFLGLIKLVKKTAVENIESKFASETESANSTIRKTLSKLSSAEETITNLTEKFNELSLYAKALEQENMELKTKIARFMSEKILKTNKNKSLTGYLRNLKEKGEEVKTKI